VHSDDLRHADFGQRARGPSCPGCPRRFRRCGDGMADGQEHRHRLRLSAEKLSEWLTGIFDVLGSLPEVDLADVPLSRDMNCACWSYHGCGERTGIGI